MSLVHDHNERLDLEHRTHRIAFAAHAFVSCVATDFIDPFVGAMRQYTLKYGAPAFLAKPLDMAKNFTGSFHDMAHGHDHAHDHGHCGHDHHHHEIAPNFDHMEGWDKRWAQFKHFSKEGHLGHWLGAEAVGDVGGAASFIALSEYAPEAMDKYVAATAKIPGVHAFIEKVAHKTTDSWAEKHHVEKDSAHYREELKKWEEFQAQNISFSFLISALGTVENLAAHKMLFKNPAPMQELLIGKMWGVLATNVLLMGSRVVAPETVKWYEDKASHVVEPLLKHTRKPEHVVADSKVSTNSHQRDSDKMLKNKDYNPYSQAVLTQKMTAPQFLTP